MKKTIRIVVSNNSIRFGFNVCQLQKERRSTTATATSVSSSARANAATAGERC